MGGHIKRATGMLNGRILVLFYADVFCRKTSQPRMLYITCTVIRIQAVITIHDYEIRQFTLAHKGKKSIISHKSLHIIS